MYTKSKKYCKHNYKTYIGKKEVVRTLRNSLSDFVLTQSRNNRKLTWRNDKEMPGLFSRRVQSLPTTGGRTKSIAIDRDKRLRRKRRSKLDPYMDTLSLIKKKNTMCIPSSCSREESRDDSAIASVAVNPRTLSSISEIDKQISTRCLRSNEVTYVDTKLEENTRDNSWITTDECSKDEKSLKFIRISESFKDETSEDESMDVLDLHFIELNKNEKVGKIDCKSHAKASYVVRACFPGEEEKDVLMEVERNKRNSCIEGKLKAKSSDAAEIQHDVPKSANVIDKPSITIKSDYSPIKHAVYRRFETPRILQDETFVKDVQREKTEPIVNHQHFQSRDCVDHEGVANSSRNSSRNFSRQLDTYLLDPDYDRVRTFTDKLSTAASSARTRCKSGEDVGDEASSDNVDSQGVYLDEDYHFLMSLHHQLNKMSLVRKMKVKAKIQTIFYEELRARIRDPHNAA